MLLLIPDVPDNPRKILGSETHHPVTALPSKNLMIRNPVIDVVRTGAFQLANLFTEQQRRRDRDRHVNMVIDTPARVNHDASCLPGVIAKKFIERSFKVRLNQSSILLGMPGDMNVKLTVDISRHRRPPFNARNRRRQVCYGKPARTPMF
jgi:hypothetical protein